MIGIIDYGSGNIRAICKVYESLLVDHVVVGAPKNLENISKIILPGVGAFDAVMNKLISSGFIKPLEKMVLDKNIPILGICVGMQILSEGSDEGELPGLSWIKGRVKMFDVNLIDWKPKIPHMGWNSIELVKSSPLFEGVNLNIGFYFIHSYYFDCEENDDILARTTYGVEFTSAVQYKNIFGVQFHPEKSHSNGLNLLKNFAEL